MAAASGGGLRLLTLQEAADFLGVTRAAVHQMLNDGRLDGPRFSGRATAGAGRVTQASAAEERARRAAKQRGRRPRKPDVSTDLRSEIRDLRAEVRRLTSQVTDLETRQAGHDDRLLHMKIAADEARAAARSARKGNRKLLKQLAESVASAESALEQADSLDGVADGYSATLTSLLVPDDPAALDDKDK